MIKQELVLEISKRTGIDKLTILTTMETFMGVIKTNMSKGKNIYLRGFGTFVVKKRAEKKARNISKKTVIKIPAHYVPIFKPSKAFISRVKSSRNITIKLNNLALSKQ